MRCGGVQKLVPYLHEPFRTNVLVCVAFGLRISEALGLKWREIDWLRARLTVERWIVRQVVEEVKTENSDTVMNIAPELLDVLKAWKQATEFAGADDWIFASPCSLAVFHFRTPEYCTYSRKRHSRPGSVLSVRTRCATHIVHGWTREQHWPSSRR